jgi:hypothetical protein
MATSPHHRDRHGLGALDRSRARAPAAGSGRPRGPRRPSRGRARHAPHHRARPRPGPSRRPPLRLRPGSGRRRRRPGPCRSGSPRPRVAGISVALAALVEQHVDRGPDLVDRGARVRRARRLPSGAAVTTRCCVAGRHHDRAAPELRRPSAAGLDHWPARRATCVSRSASARANPWRACAGPPRSAMSKLRAAAPVSSAHSALGPPVDAPIDDQPRVAMILGARARARRATRRAGVGPLAADRLDAAAPARRGCARSTPLRWPTPLGLGDAVDRAAGQRLDRGAAAALGQSSRTSSTFVGAARGAQLAQRAQPVELGHLDVHHHDDVDLDAAQRRSPPRGRS